LDNCPDIPGQPPLAERDSTNAPSSAEGAHHQSEVGELQVKKVK
jgi:hypothetical protein